MFRFAVVFVIEAIVHRNRHTRCIGVVQRNQIDAFDHLLVLARPEIIDQCRIAGVTVRFVEHRIISAKGATVKLNSGFDTQRTNHGEYSVLSLKTD